MIKFIFSKTSPSLVLSKIILVFLIFYFFKWIFRWTGQILWEVLLDLYWSYIFIWRELTSPTCVDFVSSHLSDSNSNSLSIGSLGFLCGNSVFFPKGDSCVSPHSIFKLHITLFSILASIMTFSIPWTVQGIMAIVLLVFTSMKMFPKLHPLLLVFDRLHRIKAIPEQWFLTWIHFGLP